MSERLIEALRDRAGSAPRAQGRAAEHQLRGREDYRLLVGGFAAAVAALRTATVPASAERVVLLSGAQTTGASRPSPSGPTSPAFRRTRAAAGWPPNSSARRGASTTAAQQAGGWRNPRMVARYASAVARRVEHGPLARQFGGAVGDAVRPRNRHRW